MKQVFQEGTGSNVTGHGTQSVSEDSEDNSTLGDAGTRPRDSGTDTFSLAQRFKDVFYVVEVVEVIVVFVQEGIIPSEDFEGETV